MAAAVMFCMFAVAISGVFIGIGVIRRRNWARISILIWGGFMTFVCLATMVFSFLAFSSIPPLDLPNSTPADVGRVMHLARVFLVVFYGVPAGVGIWWLVLFTRKTVATVFANPQACAQILDASGFPQPATAVASRPSRPTCPVPLAIVAALFIFGAVSMVVVFAFYPMGGDVPIFLFGHSFAGTSHRLFLLVLGLLSGVSAIGILRLKPWALNTQIGLQFFGLLNCAATLFSPRYAPVLREMIEKMYPQNPAFAAGSPLMSDAYFRGLMFVSTLMIAVILAVLLWQRPRFLELAAAGKA